MHEVTHIDRETISPYSFRAQCGSEKRHRGGLGAKENSQLFNMLISNAKETAMAISSDPKLSICIGTFNRAAFIGATLESIISQATSECEIVVSDNGSTDNTETIVLEHARRFGQLRYVKQDVNRGLDRNYDCAVELARGEYCWLMTDDDLLRPGAVSCVLNALRQDLSVILVNYEYRTFDMTKVLQERKLDLTSDRMYGRTEMDRLFTDLDEGLWYIGSVIIKRSIWLARQRERYYGSLFIHIAVVFQESLPCEALVIAEPLISYRMGNANTYSPQTSDILLFRWPSLLLSLAVSESARRKVRSAEPWRHPFWLLILRGSGFYSLTEYQRWLRPQLTSVLGRLLLVLVALVPGVLLNSLFILCYSVRQDRRVLLHSMKQSRFNLRHWRWFK